MLYNKSPLYKVSSLIPLIMIITMLYVPIVAETDDEIDFISESEISNNNPTQLSNRIIDTIIITGNSLVSRAAIQAKIPYQVGDVIKPHKTDQLIRALYGLGYFDNIKVMGEEVSSTHINLHVIIQEKSKIESINYTGNDHLKENEIEKKLKLSEVKTIDSQELVGIIEQLKKLYIEKNYHNAAIKAELNQIDTKRVIINFIIDEGKKSLVKRVFFEGNHHLSSKQLRKLTFTREDWLLGFFDKSGSYQPDAIEYDKHVIENFYQSNGFLAARVVDVIVQPYTSPEELQVTFVIEEGDLYTVSKVSAPGNDVLTEEQILARIPIRPGNFYSKDLIRQTMESLRVMWGEFGYIYADVQPSINPDQDNKTVEISFYNDLGNKITVNRIKLVGNIKTRDNVIRREIGFNENELLTTYQMNESKRRVENLGYFEQRTGVNWKIVKVDENSADLDLILKEVKTGKMFAQIGFGGTEDFQSPSKSFKIGAGLQDTNLLGTGIIYNLNGSYSQEDRSIVFSLLNPWLLDRPIRGGIDASHRQATYDEFKNVVSPPVEATSFISGNLGFIPQSLNFTNVVIDAGIQSICYKGGKPQASLPFEFQREQANFQKNLNRIFQGGELVWTGLAMMQDTRNHPIHPSRGYQWSAFSKFGIPHCIGNFGFFKVDLDARWWTPLINEFDLVLYLHGHAGLVTSIKDHQIPYRELYHIGGPATVRGFIFGQIGPAMLGDSIGGKKAFWVNAELQFPITKDMSMRGVVFYDGGAGWDAPCASDIDRELLRNNHFNYRHSIGFGIRLTYPTAARIDWGFKLDRNKRCGESASEVHFTMAHDF